MFSSGRQGTSIQAYGDDGVADAEGMRHKNLRDNVGTDRNCRRTSDIGSVVGKCCRMLREKETMNFYPQRN